MSTVLQRGVYAITPDCNDTAKLLHDVELVLQAGVSCVQYRNKIADASLATAQAAALQALCRNHNTPLIINDDVELALRIGADGVHLGGTDGSIASARALLGDACIIGASCYADLSLAQQAKQNGASYVAFGAMFPSSTKTAAPRASLSVLSDARELGLPVVAIGGITPLNGADVVAAGADLLAAIDGIFSRPHIYQAVKAYQSCFH